MVYISGENSSYKLYVSGRVIDSSDCKDISNIDNLNKDKTFSIDIQLVGGVPTIGMDVNKIYTACKSSLKNAKISKGDIEDAIRLVKDSNGIDNGTLSLTITTDRIKSGTFDDISAGIGTKIIAVPLLTHLLTDDEYKNGIHTVILQIKDEDITDTKTVDNLAKANNVKSAIIANEHGYINGCTNGNLFIVYNGCILTLPPEKANAINISEINDIFAVARNLSIPMTSYSLRQQDVMIAKEAFIFGYKTKLIYINKINNRAINGGNIGEITHKMQQALSGVVNI